MLHHAPPLYTVAAHTREFCICKEYCLSFSPRLTEREKRSWPNSSRATTDSRAVSPVRVALQSTRTCCLSTEKRMKSLGSWQKTSILPLSLLAWPPSSSQYPRPAWLLRWPVSVALFEGPRAVPGGGQDPPSKSFQEREGKAFASLNGWPSGPWTRAAAPPPPWRSRPHRGDNS